MLAVLGKARGGSVTVEALGVVNPRMASSGRQVLLTSHQSSLRFTQVTVDRLFGAERTIDWCGREAEAGGFGARMRLVLQAAEALRAGAAHVGLMWTSVNLGSESGAPGSPGADVRRGPGAVDGEVGEGGRLTVADHSEPGRGVLHRCLPMRGPTHSLTGGSD